MSFRHHGRNTRLTTQLIKSTCIDDAIHHPLWISLNNMTGRVVITVPVALDFNEDEAQAHRATQCLGKSHYLLSMEDIVRYDARERHMSLPALNMFHTDEKAFRKRHIFFKQPHYILASNPNQVRDDSYLEIARFMPTEPHKDYVDPSNFLPIQVLGEHESLPVIYFNPSIHLASMGKAHYRAERLREVISHKSFR